MSVDYTYLFSQYLLEGANIDMAVDGSSMAKVYKYTVPSFRQLKLRRGFIVIEHGAVAFNPAHFGATGAALTNGVVVSYTTKGNGEITVETWKTNRQMRDTMFDLDQEFKTDGAYTGRWTFANDLGEDLILNPGDEFKITIQDNLSTLDYLSFKLKGKMTVIG